MNILQIHGSDQSTGGGSIAMLRLQEGIRRAGVRSRVLCINPTSPDSVALPQVRGEGRVRALTTRLGLNELHNLGSFKIPSLSACADADVFHIHCLHGGFFNYFALPMLTKTKPAIYTLHDMWPFTGHCGQSFGCERWKEGCGRCPYPDIPDPIRRDATAWEWKIKQWSYRRSNLTIVAPSKWLYGLAQESMLNRFQIEHIPHGLDTDVYRPLDRDMSRSALGIPAEKKVLLYVVRRMNLSHKTAHLKGADLLVRALQGMPDSLKKDIVLLLIGEGGDVLARELSIKVMSLGVISNDHLKVLAYSAADVFVFPSRAENLPLVVIESMACGTPTVAFNVGGMSDLVRPGLTGFLARPNDTKELSAGIVQLLENENLRGQLSQHCREIAEKEYSLQLYANRHVALYRQILGTVAA